MHTTLAIGVGLLLLAVTIRFVLAKWLLVDRGPASLGRASLAVVALVAAVALAGCEQFDGDPDEGDVCSDIGATVTDEETGEVFVCSVAGTP